MQITKANRKSIIAKLNREGHNLPTSTSTRELKDLLDGGQVGRAPRSAPAPRKAAPATTARGNLGDVLLAKYQDGTLTEGFLHKKLALYYQGTELDYGESSVSANSLRITLVAPPAGDGINDREEEATLLIRKSGDEEVMQDSPKWMIKSIRETLAEPA